LAIVGFLVGVLRNNGWPSALSILLLLPLFFRKFWKYFTGSLLIGVFSYLLIQGVLFEQIIEKDDYLDQSNAVYLHHFGAHIDAGTNLTNDEKKYLYAILPKSEWRYDECNVGELWKSSSLDRGLFLANTKKNRDISLSLLIRNPAVDISHMLRAGGPAYKFIGNRCRMKSLHGFWAWGLGDAHWVVPNDFNVQENSLLPGMIRPIMEIFKGIGYFDDELEVNFHHPAFWLFVAFFSFSVLAIRKENIRFLLPIVPALSQSVVLFLIGFTPVFRYYYSNCLVGILFLGCLFIPKEVNST